MAAYINFLFIQVILKTKILKLFSSQIRIRTKWGNMYKFERNYASNAKNDSHLSRNENIYKLHKK